MNDSLLLHIGVEGSGLLVYQKSSGAIVEKGQSGGIEYDDSFNNWENHYNNFVEFWQKYTSNFKYSWISFYPVYIDESISIFIKKEVEEFQCIEGTFHRMHQQIWLDKIKGIR